MKLLYTYFWKTLPIGDLILLALILLTFSKSSQITQPPQITKNLWVGIVLHSYLACVISLINQAVFLDRTFHTFHKGACNWMSNSGSVLGQFFAEPQRDLSTLQLFSLLGRAEIPWRVESSAAACRRLMMLGSCVHTETVHLCFMTIVHHKIPQGCFHRISGDTEVAMLLQSRTTTLWTLPLPETVRNTRSLSRFLFLQAQPLVTSTRFVFVQEFGQEFRSESAHWLIPPFALEWNRSKRRERNIIISAFEELVLVACRTDLLSAVPLGLGVADASACIRCGCALVSTKCIDFGGHQKPRRVRRFKICVSLIAAACSLAFGDFDDLVPLIWTLWRILFVFVELNFFSRDFVCWKTFTCLHQMLGR